ncbi:hypothetical protein [Herbiconiux sp.]|uniref:hypothetical protein n=1 Tax=Herbiconiux sp. TaxID=1871186 RepID=UPI0025BDF4D6|nr:hypothetical protein [Herbiconiux sp.]
MTNHLGRPSRVSISASGVLLAVAALLGVTGCVAAAPASDPPPSAALSESPSPAADDLPSLDGASADTPECQDVSPAVLAAVNATISNPLPGGSNTVPALTATPDPENAVWLLTGAIPSTSTAGGALVAWATTSDPTQPEFTGALRSVGSQTATVSSAPALQFTDAEPGGLPPAALRCADTLPRG